MGCYENLKDEFLKSMSEKDIKDVLDDLKNMREKLGLQDSTISLKDRMAEYANAQSEAKRMAAQEAERRAYINATAYRETVTHINIIRDSPKGNAFKGMEAVLVGTEGNLPRGNESIENTGHSKVVRMQSDLLTALHEAGYTDKAIHTLRKDPKFGENVIKELWGMEKAEGKAVTTDPDALKFAKVYQPWLEKVRVMQNDAGASIARLKGYTPQSWRGVDIRALGKTQAEAEKGLYDLIINHLDHEATFGNDDPVKFIKSMYDSTTTGRHGLDFKWGTGRELIFKSAEDFLAVNKIIGMYKDPLHAIDQHLISGLHNTALMEKLGPEPEKMFNRIIKEYASSERKSELTNVNLKQEAILRRDFDAVTGKLFESVSPKLSLIANGIMKIQNMAHLGNVMLSSFNDIPVSAANLRHNGIGFLDSYYQLFRNLVERYSPEQRNIILKLLGENADGTKNSAFARHSSIAQTPGFLSKGMTLFSKITGIDHWTDDMRGGNAQALSLHLADQMNDSWASMDKSIQSTLTRYGIFEKDWNIIRQSRTELAKGREYITPDAIRDIPKEAFGDMKSKEITTYKNDLEDKLRSVFVSEMNYGVVTPGLKERANPFGIFGLASGGAQRGTVWGEVQHLIMQFKWYPTTVAEKVWPRLAEQGVPAYIHFAVMGTLFGYATIAAKDMLQGKTPPEPQYANTWLRAISAGLGFSVFGDVFLDQFGKPAQGLGQRLAGPTLGLANDLYKILDNAVHGEESKAGTQAAKTALRNLPFGNLWFLNAVNNYLFSYYIQEALNPGHVQKMEDDLEKSTGNRFILRPSEYANLPR